MKNTLRLVICLIFGTIITSNAQVKISDTGSTSPAASAVLETESTTRGILPPRMTQAQRDAIASPANSLLIYQTDGTSGYYFWDGTNWLPFVTGLGGVNMVAKIASGAIAKNETFVVASNNIKLTLPAVTAADNGLAITVKNIGSHTDLVKVSGASIAVNIDGADTVKHTRWIGNTYIASGGNWFVKDRINKPDDLYDVSATSSWTTIPEILAYLNIHMTAPSVVRLGGESYTLASTQTINLPFPVSFQGLTYGITTITAATGFTGGLFSCITECYFKFISFEGKTGPRPGHDAIHLTGSGVYHEIKDCVFLGFDKGISATSNIDLWIFECDFENDSTAGIELNSSASGITFKISETDFTNCGKGIHMLQGANATVSVQNCSFYPVSGQTGIVYVPGGFTTPLSMFITNTAWNNATGSIYMSGFDFTRSDGRDADIDIENNSGIENKNPKCKVSVVDNPTNTQSLASSNSWYKAYWDTVPVGALINSYSTIKVNWRINENRLTFLPTNTKDIFMIVSGNIVTTNNRTINLGFVKNPTGTSALKTAITRYGETTLRTTGGQAYQFTTTIYIQSVAKNDKFELWLNCTSNTETVRIQDMNIFVNAQ